MPNNLGHDTYSYGDDSSEETESSKRFFNNNDIPSDDSSSSREEGAFHGFLAGQGTGTSRGGVGGTSIEVASEAKVREVGGAEAREAEIREVAEGIGA